MSLPSRFNVLVEGSSAPGLAGSGICLTHTMTFMGVIVTDGSAVFPTSTGTVCGGVTDACDAGRRLRCLWYRHALANPARGQCLRVVGDSAQHGDRASGAVSRQRRRD